MGDGLLAYIQRLEVIAFFAGYPLVYLIVKLIAGEQKKPLVILKKMEKMLPFAYALTGTLFLGYLVNNIIEFSGNKSGEGIQLSYLKIWGLLAVLFWIPSVSKKSILAFLHSLVFFCLLLIDFYKYLVSVIGKDIIRNDMKVYTTSLVLNVCTLLFVIIIQLVYKKIRAAKQLTS